MIQITNNRKGIRWAVLLCLAFCMFASYFFDDIFSTISHLFQQPEKLELGWDIKDYGIYKSAYSLLCVFGGLIICGMFIDKWGVRLTGSIYVGMMLLGAAAIEYAISESFAHSSFHSNLSVWFSNPSLVLAYAGCAVFGLGSEMAGVAVNRSISKWFKGKEIALAMGVHLAIARLGTATAMLLIPRITDTDNSFLPFAETSKGAEIGLMLILVAVITWAIFVMCDFHLDKHLASSETEKEQRKEFHFKDILFLVKNKKFILISLLCVTFYCCVVSFRKFATAIVIPRFNLDVNLASLMVSMIPFCTAIFAPLFGYMVDKIGKGPRIMVFGAVLVLLSHMMLAFAPQNHFFGYLSIILLGLSYSLIPAAMWPSIPLIVPERMLGTAFSTMYWIQNMGMMLVPIVVGKIMNDSADALQSAVYAELAFIVLAAAALFSAIKFSKVCQKEAE